MIPLKRNILSHLWFIPEGTAFTSPGAGTVSTTAWPDASESTLANFKLANCKKVTKSAPGGTRVEEWTVGTDRLELEDAYFVKNNFKLVATVTRTYAIAYGLLMNAASALNSSSSSFTPNAGLAAIRGLAKLQQYDQAGSLIAYMDIYALLTLPSDIDFDPESGEGTPWQLTLELIKSVNNAGSIVTPA
jgi:hypothetical protein